MNRALLDWFRANMRPMPWRKRPRPYACWLSEIMLQQTTYEQALPYYQRFLERFPSVEALAAADEQDVLKAWEGLGYYARARNLHRAAKTVAAEGWPKGYDGWRALPGVGPYTAAALSSVLDGERRPVVDGNVGRVFARYWLLEDDFKDPAGRGRLAERLLRTWNRDGQDLPPGDLNQAMMELGALVCTPKNPLCGTCPLAVRCRARRKGVQAEYPKNAKRGPVPVRRRTAAVIPDGMGNVLLVKNEEGGLLKGLWDLPCVEPRGKYDQTFSHFRLELDVLASAGDARPVFADPRKVPLTQAAKKVLTRCGCL